MLMVYYVPPSLHVCCSERPVTSQMNSHTTRHIHTMAEEGERERNMLNWIFLSIFQFKFRSLRITKITDTSLSLHTHHLYSRRERERGKCFTTFNSRAFDEHVQVLVYNFMYSFWETRSYYECLYWKQSRRVCIRKNFLRGNQLLVVSESLLISHLKASEVKIA